MADAFLHTWPEAIISVQSISESGANTIPDRYIKPPSQRPNSSSCEAQGAMHDEIPIIDVGGFCLEGVCLEEVFRLISQACQDWGFFQVVNHGVAPELLRKMKEVWKEFFRQPTELKQTYANTPATYEGYGSRLGVEKGVVLDWGDYFYLHFRPDCLKKPKIWPAIPLDLKETIDEYSREMTTLCHRFTRALASNLALSDDRFLNALGGIDAVSTCFRANYYPKCPQPELTLGLSPHSDPGGITVLLLDEVTGLQVRRHNCWLTVKPLPNSLIINMGDQIQVLSNGRYKSVEHRVVVNSMRDRLSLAFFYNPKGDLPIAPLPELVSDDHPAQYSAMTFDEYRLYIRKAGPKGKSNLEENH